MSSIIVLDSSDEETDNGNKKVRKGLVAKSKDPPIQSMARVNPVKGQNSVVKKSTATPPSDNFKIQLPSKRSNPIEVNQVPEKRIRRVKPTTIVKNNDEEWFKRQTASSAPSWNGDRTKGAIQAATTNKTLVNTIKNQTKVVKSPTQVGNVSRVGQSNTSRLIVNSTAQNNSKVAQPNQLVRVAYNGKEPKPSSPSVINKNITTFIKEPPKTLSLPPGISKNITTTIKDPNMVTNPSPIFNKNNLTIRRVVVSEERPKGPISKSIVTTTPAKVDQSKQLVTNTITPNIKRAAPTNVDPLKITLPQGILSKPLNNSTVKIMQIHATPSTVNAGAKKVAIDQSKSYQHLPTLKRNDTNARTVPNSDPLAVTSNPVIYTSPNTTVKKIMTIEVPTTTSQNTTTPVITKVYGSAPKRTEQQAKSTMSMSVITKANTSSIKATEQKPSPPLNPKSTTIINRSSGLIVTPIISAVGTIPTPTTAPTTLTMPTSVASLTTSTAFSKPARSVSNTTRAAPKQKAANTRGRPSTAAAEQAMASMFNMFSPGSGFLGNPQMMYDMNPSTGQFMNTAYAQNRSVRSAEGSSYPTMASPVFNVNHPVFSGGSITPVMSPGTAPSPGRSSKSPVTSTVTRSSSATRSPAGFMNMPIDVDQPLAPMSPPIFNMNHPPFNGDPFNFMRNPHNIPSPSFSPVRSTRSPSGSKAGQSNSTTESGGDLMPAFHRDLDNFVRNPFSYPRTPSNVENSPIVLLDSPPKDHDPIDTPTPVGLFKASVLNPVRSINGQSSELNEVKKDKDKKSIDENSADKKENNENNNKNDKENNEEAEIETEEKEEVKEPLNTDFEALLSACREADSSDDMNKLIDTKLIRYYYSVHPDFVKSRGFRKAVIAATESVKKNPDLVYYHLRPVVEELKARKKCKNIVMTNDETSVATAATDEKIEDKVRNRQIRRLNKGLYILTRKIHKLENDEVDLDDENSTYLIVERYKKRACEIYDKICNLTGESKHALRQVKKPITFKATEYPKFNKVLETFVNRTKEFPDFFDVLRMLEFCNTRHNFGLAKEEMTGIAQDAFLKIGKLLQSRRKADLYETVSHFTSDIEDPAANDPQLLAKLSENEKKQTSIGSIIDKYAREQYRRKSESDAESNVASEDDTSSKTCDTDDDEEEKSKTKSEKHKKEKHNKNDIKPSENKEDKPCENPTTATTNGDHSPSPPLIVPLPPPSPSTSTAFRTSPPHAFASPQASPRPRSVSPIPSPSPLVVQPQTLTTSSLKILSVTSLNENATDKNTESVKPIVTSVDEIVISDEDL